MASLLLAWTNRLPEDHVLAVESALAAVHVHAAVLAFLAGQCAVPNWKLQCHFRGMLLMMLMMPRCCCC